MALQHMHRNGFLHCNLKPSNILVDEYGNIRLCDFKKVLKVNAITPQDTKKNKAAMTPCYTAPELFSEDGTYNYKTDLWALGCIMYELAVGQVPFFDESVGKLIGKIINEDVNFNRKELQNFSDEFVDCLRRLLEKDPNSRISWSEIERHHFWEFNVNDGIELVRENSADMLSKPQSSRVKSAKSLSSPGVGLEKKKTVDILRLSKNALQHMMNDREDEYARDKNNKAKEVDNADQEFNFDGNEDKKDDAYDSEKT
jgi:serine/threonine protein kinase